MKIKYCGIKRNEDVDYVNETMPDYIGFIFAPTKRLVTMEQADGFKKRLDSRIQAVGVFVNEIAEKVAEIANKGIIDVIQLHGQEDAEYIAKLKSLLIESKPLIKAIRVQTAQDILDGQELDVDFILLDKYDAEKLGGTGEKFDWNLIGNIKKPFFLAGGIDIDSLEDAVKMKPYGIDVSSGIETDGCKDLAKMRVMMEKFRAMQ